MKGNWRTFLAGVALLALASGDWAHATGKGDCEADLGGKGESSESQGSKKSKKLSWEEIVDALNGPNAARWIKEQVAEDSPAIKDVRKRMQQELLDFAERTKTIPPSMDEFAQAMGIDSKALKALFGEDRAYSSLRKLVSELKESKPKLFELVKDLTLYTPERLEEARQAFRKSPRAIFTAWVTGQELNPDTWNALLTLSRRMDAPIYIAASYGEIGAIPDHVFELPNVHVIADTWLLNPYWVVDSVALMPKMKNPQARLDELGAPHQNVLAFAPQAVVSSRATGQNTDYPAQEILTGAITDPYYDAKTKSSMRTNKLAEENHFVGAVLIEKTPGIAGIDSDGVTPALNYRHIEYVPPAADGSLPGGFMDLAHFYGSDGRVRRIKHSALILGDLHIGVTDPKASLAVRVQLLSPGALNLKDSAPEFDVIVEHDASDGSDINHHEADNHLLQAQKGKRGEISYEDHLKVVAEHDNAIHQLQPKATIVKAYDNHGAQWIGRWISGATFMGDPNNAAFGAQIFAELANGGTGPAIRMAMTKAGFDRPNQVVILGPGQSFQVGWREVEKGVRRVEIGQHGHAGPNGSRSLSLNAQQKAYGWSVVGHYHTTERINHTVRVGTLTPPRQAYSLEGPSKTNQSVALVGPNGEIQILNLVDGYFYTPLGSQVGELDTQYPKVIPPKTSTAEGSGSRSDQWTERK